MYLIDLNFHLSQQNHTFRSVKESWTHYYLYLAIFIIIESWQKNHQVASRSIEYFIKRFIFMYDLKKIIELKELNEKIIGSNNISTKWLNLVRKLEYTIKKKENL